MSSYMEIRAAKVKSWEEEQLCSLNKVVKEMHEEVRIAKCNESKFKKKLQQSNVKIKKLQDSVKRLCGEKEVLNGEKMLLSTKIENLEKEVTKAHNETIDENDISKYLEDAPSSDLDDSLIENKPEENKSVEEKQTTVEEVAKQEENKDEAVKMMEDIRSKLEKLNLENISLKEELSQLKDKNNTYQEGMIMIKDCFGDANQSFREEKSDFVQCFVQSILDSVNDLKRKIEVLESDRENLNNEINQKNEEISEKNAEISIQVEKLKEKDTEFQQNLSDLNAQKTRTEKALDQIQKDLNESVEKNGNLTTLNTEITEEVENLKQQLNNLEQLKSKLTEDKEALDEILEDKTNQLNSVSQNRDNLEEKCSDLDITISDLKSTCHVLQNQLTLSQKVNTELEGTLKRTKAHLQSVECENNQLKERCESYEEKVEGLKEDIKKEKENLKSTMANIEEVLLDKQKQMKEMKEGVKNVSENNQKLLSQVEKYRKTVKVLEKEKKDILVEMDNFKEACYVKADKLKNEKNEIARELQLRLDVAQKANEEVLRNEQEVKEQMQNSYVRKLLRAETELRQKDIELGVAEIKLKKTKSNNDHNLSLRNEDIDDLECRLELSREESDFIRNDYEEKLIIARQIIDEKDETLYHLEENFTRMKEINKKLMNENKKYVLQIKEFKKKERSKRFEKEDYNFSSTSAQVGCSLKSRKDEYEDLLEKLAKLEDHLASCAENSASKNVREYHLCRLENVHLEHENTKMKILLQKLPSSYLKNLDDCLEASVDGERINLSEKINDLDEIFSRFEIDYYDVIEELKDEAEELKRMCEAYEDEMRRIARRRKVPMMLKPMYSNVGESYTENNDTL